eukprot:gene3741-2637_t
MSLFSLYLSLLLKIPPVFILCNKNNNNNNKQTHAHNEIEKKRQEQASTGSSDQLMRQKNSPFSRSPLLSRVLPRTNTLTRYSSIHLV